MALRTTKADLYMSLARLHSVSGRAIFHIYGEGGKVKLIRCEGRGGEDMFPLSSISILEKRIDALTMGIRLGREHQ